MAEEEARADTESPPWINLDLYRSGRRPTPLLYSFPRRSLQLESAQKPGWKTAKILRAGFGDRPRRQGCATPASATATVIYWVTLKHSERDLVTAQA